jgi:hypothetical protein
VAQQAGAAPKELWSDGVEDYLRHAQQLLADYSDVLQNGGSSKHEAASAPAAAPAPPAAAKPPLAPSTLFGRSGSGAAAPPASIFGGLPAAGAGGSATGGFGSFGGFGGGAANNGGSGLFTVPSTGTLGSSFNTGAATGGDDDEEGEEAQDAEPSVGGDGGRRAQGSEGDGGLSFAGAACATYRALPVICLPHLPTPPHSSPPSLSFPPHRRCRWRRGRGRSCWQSTASS